MLRASTQMGFTDQMHGPTREAATTESEYVEYIFVDAQAFIKELITAMMDEPSTRESVTRVILKINA